MANENPFHAFDHQDAGTLDEHLELLTKMQPWLYLMGGLALLGGALMAMGSLGMGAMGLVGGAMADEIGGGAEIFGSAVLFLIALFYGLVGAMYLALGYFIFRQGLAIGSVRFGGGSAALLELFRYQLHFWRTLGGMMLALVVLYCGGIFAMFGFGVLFS